jgi:hypothetical protein
MPRISMLVPDEALELIDSVSDNRTAFMVQASVREARKRRRQLVDAEVARICRETAERDRAIAREWESTLADGLEDE